MTSRNDTIFKLLNNKYSCKGSLRDDLLKYSTLEPENNQTIFMVADIIDELTGKGHNEEIRKTIDEYEDERIGFCRIKYCPVNHYRIIDSSKIIKKDKMVSVMVANVIDDIREIKTIWEKTDRNDMPFILTSKFYTMLKNIVI